MGVEEVGPSVAAMPGKCADSATRGRPPPAAVDTGGMDPARWWTQIHHIDEFASKCSPDDAIATLASRQGGVVARRQLASLGLARGAIDRRISQGRLRPYFHGVYAVGHEALQLRGRLVAGLLVAGPGAALTHRTAGGLLRLTLSMPPFVEITTTATRPRSRPGLAFHHAATIDATASRSRPPSAPCSTSPSRSRAPTSSARAARRSCWAS